MGTLALINPRKSGKSGKSGGSYVTRLKRETVSNAQNVGILAATTLGAGIAVNVATSILARKRVQGVALADRAKVAGNTALMVSGGATVAGLALMPLVPVIGMALAVTGAHGLIRQGVSKVDTNGTLSKFEMDAKLAEYRKDPTGGIDGDMDGYEDVFVPGSSRQSDVMADVNTQPAGAGQAALFRVA
jgi:hypothetical protein